MTNVSGKTSDRPIGKRNMNFGGSDRPGSPPGYKLVGPFNQNTGNAQYSDWTLGPHTLTLSGGNCHGIRVRQTEQDEFVRVDPANPPPGVVIAGAVIDVNRVWQRKERHPEIAQIIDYYTDRMGKTAKDYWRIFYQAAQATSATTEQDFIEELDVDLDAADLDLAASKVLGALIGRLKEVLTLPVFNALTGASDLEKTVLWIKDKNSDQLQGNNSEVVEEYGNG